MVPSVIIMMSTVSALFLEIAFVQVCVCVFVDEHVSVHEHMCVYAPEGINYYSHEMNQNNQLNCFYIHNISHQYW